MKKLKLISSILLVASVLTLSPIGVNASSVREVWQKDSKGWWYGTENGSWWATGWKLIDGNWYYFDEDMGYMAHDTTIDGYYLNSNGAWTTSVPTGNNQNGSLTMVEAEKLLERHDSDKRLQSTEGLLTTEDGRECWQFYWTERMAIGSSGYIWVDKNTGEVKNSLTHQWEKLE